ncbi:MAG: homoserine O-succinyltransferase [Verrucomicrobiales bacterium]|jgi:homoserine O-succinyltransferase|nr:homoserine O-succinyltransferase [Verrucomicrobiales bacterium]
MPVNIPDGLPAAGILAKENIFVMDRKRALAQDIRPLHIAILNLMPTKETTETQLLRLLGNTPIQIEPVFLTTKSYTAKNTSAEYLAEFYRNFDDIKPHKFDGLIITGAPVEQMPFEQVQYWDELTQIFDWAETNAYSSMFICWGAQAALYHYYGIPKQALDKKIFGVFPHRNCQPGSKLLSGFDDVFPVPHSRHTTVLRADIEKHPELQILSESDEAGVYLVAAKGERQVFLTGHSEYDRETLKKEYLRDLKANLPIEKPANYFPNNDANREPLMTWRTHSHLLFSNWINNIYQETPYNIDELPPLTANPPDGWTI